MGVKVRYRKGAYWIFVNHKGQRKAKRVGEGKEGQRAAGAAAERIQAKLVLGDLSLLEEPALKEMTLQEYAEQWLATDVALRLKAGTVDKYGEVLRNHWFPELGRSPLSAITREQVKSRLQRKLMGGMKPNMARSMFGVLRTCLNAAMEEGLITRNPVERMGKFIARSRVDVDIFTPEELMTLLHTANEEMPAAYPLVLLLARTGLRVGEALTLQVNDLDLGRTAYVCVDAYPSGR